MPPSRYNICVLQPDGYAHSFAFLELAELVCYSLRELGHDAELKFNDVRLDRRNIVIGCHLAELAVMEHMPAGTVILNTEQLDAGAEGFSPAIFEWARRFEVWDYSERNIARLRDLGIDHVKRLRLGFQKELARIRLSPSPDIDVLFYGTMNDRRHRIVEALERRGVAVHCVYNVYGRERDSLIARSKLVLNLHVGDTQIFEIVRVFYLLTNAVPVVAEVNPTTSIDRMYAHGIAGVPYDGLVAECVDLLRDPAKRSALGARGLECLSRFPQREFTRAVVS